MNPVRQPSPAAAPRPAACAPPVRCPPRGNTLCRPPVLPPVSRLFGGRTPWIGLEPSR